jgi:hypothetical protein
MIKTILIILIALLLPFVAIKQGELNASQKNFDNCLTYFDHLPLHEIKPLCQDILDGIKRTDPFEDPEIHK